MNRIREIKFYRTANGRCPVEEFLDSLSGNAAKRVTWMLELIREVERIPECYFKKLRGTDDIWECRVQFGSNTFRLLGFWPGHSTLDLTHGFIKKSQKTPRREIKRAERFKDEFLRRSVENG